MLSEMRLVIQFVLVIVAMTGFAHGQADLQTELRKEFVGSARTIRNFYSDSSLKYDTAGQFLGHSPAGPWTIYGGVIIGSVKLLEAKLELDGQRFIQVYDKDQKKLAKSRWAGELLKIEIASPPGEGRRDRLLAALKQVFISPDEDLSKAFPDYWVRYIGAGRYGTCEAAPRNIELGTAKSNQDSSVLALKNDPGKDAAGDLPTKVRVSQGVLEGAKIKDVPPSYPAFAKLAHIQGDVTMAATIDKSSNIANLCVRQPAGGGLDEAAVEAVEQWKYRPYLLKGQLVEVETLITVRFHM